MILECDPSIVRASIGDFGDPAPHSRKVLQLWFSACGSDEALWQHQEVVVKVEMKDEEDEACAKHETEEGGEEDISNNGIVTCRRRGGRSRSRYNKFCAAARKRTPTP